MVAVTKPRRGDIVAMANGNMRLVEAIEGLFDSVGNEDVDGAGIAVSLLGAFSAIIGQISQESATDRPPFPVEVAPVGGGRDVFALPPALAGLPDVDAGSISGGDVLRWDSSTDRFSPVPLTGATGSFTNSLGDTLTITDGLITAIT